MHKIHHTVGYLLSECRAAQFARIDQDEHLRTSGTTPLLDFVDRVRRRPFGKHGGQQIEHDGKTGAFPIAHRQDAHRFFNRSRLGGKHAVLIKTGGEGHRLALHSRGLQFAVRKLRHGHVQNHVSFFSRRRDHQRIVAQARILGAPGRHAGFRVGPTDRDQPTIRSAPAVRSAAHPMGRVSQRHDADTLLSGHLHGAVGREERIQDSGAAMTVVYFNRPSLPHKFRLRVQSHPALGNVIHKSRHAVQSVRVHSVAARFGVDARAKPGVVVVHARVQKCRRDRSLHFGERNSGHL